MVGNLVRSSLSDLFVLSVCELFELKGVENVIGCDCQDDRPFRGRFIAFKSHLEFVSFQFSMKPICRDRMIVVFLTRWKKVFSCKLGIFNPWR
jgi:hypothetical protein